MPDVREGDHVGTTFRSAAEFVYNTVAFAERAIPSGALVMVFPGDPFRDALDTFGAVLARGSDRLARAVAAGQVRVADSRLVQGAPGRFDPAYLHDAYTAAVRQATDAGYRGLWVSVDMAWAADAEREALAAFEAKAFPLFATGDLTAMCQYGTGVYDPATAAAACRAHPARPGGGPVLRHRPAGDPGGLYLSGETDADNHLAFAALVDSLRPGDHLDLTGMSFMDVGAIGLVARAAARTPNLGVSATPHHRRLLDLATAAQP
jgi:hypothetical protein